MFYSWFFFWRVFLIFSCHFVQISFENFPRASYLPLHSFISNVPRQFGTGSGLIFNLEDRSRRRWGVQSACRWQLDIAKYSRHLAVLGAFAACRPFPEAQRGVHALLDDAFGWQRSHKAGTDADSDSRQTLNTLIDFEFFSVFVFFYKISIFTWSWLYKMRVKLSDYWLIALNWKLT